MATAYHNLSDYDFNSVPSAENMKFGIVVSEWNYNITGALLKGAAFPACILSKSGPGIERKGGECSQVCKRQLSLRETFS